MPHWHWLAALNDGNANRSIHTMEMTHGTERLKLVNFSRFVAVVAVAGRSQIEQMTNVRAAAAADDAAAAAAAAAVPLNKYQ